ncbi:hypothetical protein SopranoGao_55 [Klebsiella phage SopranoGao]|uniref:Thoeris anti-defense 2-like domain-containing protein n=1 Tax=Klebsiella phage SopranoGao TaxID=2026944 RepID=A0A248SKZ7_9CAUD|nr:hypothetical protein KMC54_gp55 [Klebsiella phage SopranoGao]ASV45078.1 hypothetical protein SopranoGao_55 [Klebsiella phage SopranoGao]
MNVNELPQYKCHKVVRAGKILATARNPNEDAVFLDVDGVVNKWLFAPTGWLNKHNPDIGGYLVAYEDGYLSYSPAAAFEAGYSIIIDKDSNGTVLAQKADGTETLHFQGSTPASTEIDLDAADFSDALMWLKEGKRVQRAGWNGKGQYVQLWQLPPDITFDGAELRPCFILKNAQGVAQAGWVPSMGDLLATDWQVVA